MDQVILITGASSGIGEGIARALAVRGAKVLMGTRRTDRLAAIAEDLRSYDAEMDTWSLDVTDIDSMQEFTQAALSLWGRIDMLVNNAGVMPLSPLCALKLDEWERMVDVNIKGVLWGIGAGLPVMEGQSPFFAYRNRRYQQTGGGLYAGDVEQSAKANHSA